VSLLGLEHLGDNWLADAHGVLWNRAYQASTPVREHQWHTNGCPSCSGCVYPGCTVHETCDCAKGQAA
jgi:hypothetical protein